MDFLYLAAGKLHLKQGGAPVRTIESVFGRQVRERAMSIRDRHAWKMKGTGARFMGQAMPWGADPHDPAQMRIQISGVSIGCQTGQLFYTLDTPEIGGLFALENDASQEQRLFHTADFRLRQISADRERDRIAFVVQDDGGTSNIACMRGDGSEMMEVTQGDAIDLSPSWVPGQNAIVYQSAGIGRNADGVALGYGPFGVHKIDLENGATEALVEDSSFDFLTPRLTADGTLYAIRRPYKSPFEPVSIWRALLDFVLLPFRLLYAIFHYLNFFSAMYTGKTLTSSGGAKQQEADLRRMMIFGNMIDARDAMRRQKGEATPDLVPKTWELVRRRPGAGFEVLAKGVLAFDLHPSGVVLYSNGSGIFSLDAAGNSACLHKDVMIEQVVALR